MRFLFNLSVFGFLSLLALAAPFQTCEANWTRASLLWSAVIRSASSEQTRSSFWKGGEILPGVPHVSSHSLLGHIGFTLEDADLFTQAALQHPNGLSTYWSGPTPVIIVAKNSGRHGMILEGLMGPESEEAAEIQDRLTGGNQVMSTFPAFRNIHSNAYNLQRKFLMGFFQGGAKDRLQDIESATQQFFKDYLEKFGERPLLLRELVIALVLRTSSSMMGLDRVPLDQAYLTDSKYRERIKRVAHYGIIEKVDLELEKELNQIFAQMIQDNFESIRRESPQSHLIQNIFASLDVSFPERWEDFKKIPAEKRHTIGMNFMASGIGALVHSTANSLDWAVARLLKDPVKLAEFKQLMAEHRGVDVTRTEIYEKDGVLFPIAAWVLHTIFLYPTFAFENFINRQSFVASFADGSTLTVPSMSITIVNYAACNRSEPGLGDLEGFTRFLKEDDAVGHFVCNERVASFGGSKINRVNRKTRLCPGAKTSIYEQAVIIATLLRDYSIEWADPDAVSLELSSEDFPLYARRNTGQIRLEKLKRE